MKLSFGKQSEILLHIRSLSKKKNDKKIFNIRISEGELECT